jgi:L-malate glycosyltransferase
MEVAILSFGAATDALVEVCHTRHVPLSIIKGKSWREQKQRLALLSRFDVIHIHSPAALKSLVLHLCLLRHKHLIYTRHGAAPLNKPHWIRLHRFARYFIKCVTFVSADAKQSFSHHGWHKVPQYVVDNGVKVPALAVPTSRRDVLRLGSVGRMVSLKSQISLLKAVALLGRDFQQQVELHFFGDGELRAELEAFHHKNPAISAFFHGVELNREHIYPRIDALVVTSSTEGLSMVILEAMAYAKPVIATNVGGNPVLVNPNVTGWLYAFDDTAQLAKLIQQLLVQWDTLDDIGLQARQWVEQHYSLALTAKRYQELYHAR